MRFPLLFLATHSLSPSVRALLCGKKARGEENLQSLRPPLQATSAATILLSQQSSDLSLSFFLRSSATALLQFGLTARRNECRWMTFRRCRSFLRCVCVAGHAWIFFVCVRVRLLPQERPWASRRDWSLFFSSFCLIPVPCISFSLFSFSSIWTVSSFFVLYLAFRHINSLPSHTPLPCFFLFYGFCSYGSSKKTENIGCAWGDKEDWWVTKVLFLVYVSHTLLIGLCWAALLFYLPCMTKVFCHWSFIRLFSPPPP